MTWSEDPQDHDDSPPEIDPSLLTWLPLGWRDWLLAPLLLVALSVIVLLAARGHGSAPAAHRLDVGWQVSAVAGIIVALVMVTFAYRAYAEVTERAAIRYRRGTIVAFGALAAVLAVTGVLSNNTFLASSAMYALLPLVGRARGAVVALGERDVRRARRIATAALAVAVGVILLALALALFGPANFATIYVISNGFVYGAVVAVGAAVTRQRLGRTKGPA